MDNITQQNPASEMMGKKVGGKWTIGQYISYQKKYYMWLVIAAVVIGALSLIPGVFFLGAALGWLVLLFGLFVYFWFGYQMAKEKKGEVKDALIGGGVLGVILGAITGIFGLVSAIILASTVPSSLGALGGVGAGFGVTAGILSLVYSVIGGAVGGLVLSLIGFAVAGGFSSSKPMGTAQ